MSSNVIFTIVLMPLFIVGKNVQQALFQCTIYQAIYLWPKIISRGIRLVFSGMCGHIYFLRVFYVIHSTIQLRSSCFNFQDNSFANKENECCYFRFTNFVTVNINVRARFLFTSFSRPYKKLPGCSKHSDSLNSTATNGWPRVSYIWKYFMTNLYIYIYINQLH